MILLFFADNQVVIGFCVVIRFSVSVEVSLLRSLRLWVDIYYKDLPPPEEKGIDRTHIPM